MESEEKAALARKRHVPIIDERQVTDFDICLQRIGVWNTTGRSFTNDGAPGIIRLRWIIPGELWCDEEGMLQFLDQRLYRQVLRWILHASALKEDEAFLLQDGWREEPHFLWKSDDLAQAVKRDTEDLFPILRFLMLQEYLVEQGSGIWTRGPALTSIFNMGATLEWCVQAHFQRRHQAVARRCVHFKEWEAFGLNDLDVLTFIDDLVIFLECKSSSAITLGQLTRFVKRARAFPADVALLLIDTQSFSSVEARVRQIKMILGLEEAHQEETFRHEGSQMVFLPAPIVVANIGERISHTLDHILHLAKMQKGLLNDGATNGFA